MATPIEVSEPQKLTSLDGLIVGADAMHFLDADVVHNVALIIAEWSYVELEVASVANTFLAGPLASTAAIFQALRDKHSRKNALVHAARVAGVPDADVEWIIKVLRAVNKAGDRRNEYAHHLWAFSKKASASLVLVPPWSRAIALAQSAEDLKAHQTWQNDLDAMWIAETSRPPRGPRIDSVILRDVADAQVFTLTHQHQDYHAMQRAQDLTALLGYVLRGGPTRAPALKLLKSYFRGQRSRGKRSQPDSSP